MTSVRAAASAYLALVLLTTSGCTALLPAADMHVADCSTLTSIDVARALREAPSYTYSARGTVAHYIAITGEQETHDLSTRGSYVAPDRLSVVYLGHQFELEEERIIGSQLWTRAHGSLRFNPAESPPDKDANELLDAVERITDWSPTTTEPKTGGCVLSGRGAYATVGAAVSLRLTVTTRAGSAMPETVVADFRYDPEHVRDHLVAQRSVIYQVQPGSELPINTPTVNTSAATVADLEYALRHLGCAAPPCDITSLEPAYAVHQPGLDMVGYTLDGRAGEAWFENGLIMHVVDRGCSVPAFAWHEHPGHDSFWLGGPMTVAPTATLRVTFSDGTVEESRVTSPAYIVPAREHTADGAQIVEVVLLDQDGALLAEPSVGTC